MKRLETIWPKNLAYVFFQNYFPYWIDWISIKYDIEENLLYQTNMYSWINIDVPVHYLLFYCKALKEKPPAYHILSTNNRTVSLYRR